MKNLFTVISFLWVFSAWGQARVIGEIYVNGNELEVIAHGPPYFEFNEYDTTLTTVAKHYLDDFGKSYRDSLFSKGKFLIQLTPGLTKEEREKDSDLGVKRLNAIVNYLERRYGIRKSEFRMRYSETITTDGCVGFIVQEKNAKKVTRRERKKLKKEEDNFFREKE